MSTKIPDPAGSSAKIADLPTSGRNGFIILLVLITFVGYWMYHENKLQSQGLTNAPAPLADRLDGFLTGLFYLPDDALLGFVEVPSGNFLMGSDPAFDRQAYENERWSETQRQGTVYLDNFYINRYEVTVAQFRAFLNASGRDPQRAEYGSELDHPVSNVTWTEALAYCRWLQESLLMSASTPEALRSMLQSGWTVALPTEAQWEKAARGPDGKIYPWGMLANRDFANYAGSATTAVGSIRCPECSYGLSDMSGNVWELTRSPYQPYPYDEADDRDNLEEDALWVMRGGSYIDREGNIRAAVRGGVDPGVRSTTIGFRVVLTPPG